MTNQDNITKINNFISTQITNLESGNPLSWADKVCVAEIILHLSNSLAALIYVGGSEGEEWKKDD